MMNMAASLLPGECLHALESARTWASALDWRRRESGLREMLSSITQRVNQLHLWESQRQKFALPKEQEGSIASADSSGRLAAGGGEHTARTDSASKCVVEGSSGVDSSLGDERSSGAGRSNRAIRTYTTEALTDNQNQPQRRVLVPILKSTCRSCHVHLRDPSGSRLKSYPLYEDAEIGLEEIGHVMDVEMTAVPSNCREDDDVQTTSDVLALGVETVERYLKSVLVLADKYLERPVKRRRDKLNERIFKA
ncbi:hypothetical protein Efla_002896 [Eimeria flavescens]